MRFLGLSLGDRTPDENTIWHFRNRMTETGTLQRVMKAFGFIRTIGLKSAEAKMIQANLAYNFDCLIFHERSRGVT